MNQYCNNLSVNDSKNLWVYLNANISLKFKKRSTVQRTKQRAACKTHVSWIKSARVELSPWHTLKQNNEVPAGV